MNTIATMECRAGCGACCIAPSINTPIPGMPQGKPAGVRCVQLSDDQRCRLFGDSQRPAFCASLQPSAQMCGDSREHALEFLGWLERETRPAAASGNDGGRGEAVGAAPGQRGVAAAGGKDRRG